MASALRICFVVAASLTLLACEPCMKISIRAEPSADFTQLSTYQWWNQTPQIEGETETDPDWLNGQIRSSIDSRLTNNGYVKAPDSASEVDFLVGYHAAVEHKFTETQVNHRYGFPRDRSPAYDLTTRGIDTMHPKTVTFEYDVGTLMIDVIDPQTQQVIWRGSAQSEVHLSKSNDQKRAKIEQAVTKILERFPPS